ncbi:Rrt5p NDAI_0G02050 [Naumovozyma dairenensis CBS 421]|uniref:Regulator of rDNA transcription protein 5 n=1 Tax=Naumovozyma dairenensis (strain ATCC 10597 / BCRC 20456 / CBS 421 / NBRC 0211 / NRRL Y-12639) TaxID=1071378 RepID=G0WDW9_NAUDC|nr:hypothetical protein NDAI_0G02050 [Naumovozyma dairenensis CBS 421]CCD25980.2 hypothetical protein NDAI_0G02050 [Naumovozyma dairenensis CBS 421]
MFNFGPKSASLSIRNLSYYTGEQELRNYLKDYEIVSLFIVTETVRGIKERLARPLGIAYVELSSIENAEKVIKDLNKKQFQGKTLFIKYHVPYEPRFVPRYRNEEKNQKANTENGLIKKGSEDTKLTDKKEVKETNPIVEANTDSIITHAVVPETSSKNAKQKGTKSLNGRHYRQNRRNQEKSKDTLYCSSLPKNVTDEELREFFKGYNPQEIWIYRQKTSKVCLPVHSKVTAALVTIGSEDKLIDIIKVLRERKILGKKILLYPAYISKIEEIKEIARKTREEQGIVEEVVVEDDTTVRTEDQQPIEATAENEDAGAGNVPSNKKAVARQKEEVRVTLRKDDNEVSNKQNVPVPPIITEATSVKDSDTSKLNRIKQEPASEQETLTA